MNHPDRRISPVTFNLILKSNTHRVVDLITWTLIFAVTGALIPLVVPIPFFIIAAFQIIMQPVRYWRTLLYRDAEAAALTVRVRGIFPGGPDITAKHLSKLVKAGRLTVDGVDGSRLRLVLSDTVRIRKMRDSFAVRAAFCPADFGLAEFDRIMADLVHSVPVAAAMKRISGAEQYEGPVIVPDDLDYPEKPSKPVTEKPAFFQPDDYKSDEFKAKQEAKAAQRKLKADTRI